MNKSMQMVAALALILGLAAGADARMRGKGMAMGRDGEHFAHYMKTLNLTEAQQDLFQEMYNKVQKEVIRKKADRGVAEIELREILDGETPDLKSAEAKIRQIASFGADIRVLHLKSAAEFRAKLTPEQQTKFDDLDESRFLGMDMERGMGMGMGPHHGMMGGSSGAKGMMGKEGCPMMKGMGHGSTQADDSSTKGERAPTADNPHKNHGCTEGGGERSAIPRLRIWRSSF
jgi:Spy/CpxP family protein refolding chaperone